MDRDVKLSAEEADELFDILEDVVVSLDRIGSREASGEDPEHNWIHEYFSTGGATSRIARARYILSLAFDQVYTEDELEARWADRPSRAWTEPKPDDAISPPPADA